MLQENNNSQPQRRMSVQNRRPIRNSMQRVPLRQQNMTGPTLDPRRKRPSLNLRPLFISILLIVLIFGSAFMKKTKVKEAKEAEKQAFLEQEQQILQVETETISPAETERAIRNKKFQIIDIRNENEFQAKHIESSVNIPITNLEEKINSISTKKIIIIIDREDSPAGKILNEHLRNEGLNARYLKGGILSYAKEGRPFVNLGSPMLNNDLLKVTSYSIKELLQQVEEGARFKIVDTRSKLEFSNGHIADSINIPLEDLENQKDKLPIRLFIIVDKDPIRSFQAAVRIYDMDIINAMNCTGTYQGLKNALEEKS